ncbi:MAG: hemolysin family protein [Rhodothermales bacterium]
MLGLFLLLLLASALFSGSEVALFSLDGTAKEALTEARDRASQRVLKLLKEPRQILITILLLNTFVNVSAAILAALMTERVAREFALNPTIVFILEAIALTFVLLVVSEITPKLIATRHARTFSRRVSGLLMVLHVLLRPLSIVLSRAMLFVQRRFQLSTATRLSSEDVKAMAEIGEAHGTFKEEERELIHSIVEFGDTPVRAIMISRLDIEALPVTATLSEALDIIRSSGHSRLPLYVDHLDNILGVIYAKDLLPYLNNSNGIRRIDWTRLMRPPMFVPQGRKLDDLLKDFQRKKTHLAIVVDEYGGTAGIVTLEDVLEEIVGDIRDEHDEPEDVLFKRLDDGTYRVDARIDLDDLNDLLDLDLDTESFDFETLGGLIFHLTGEIPFRGDEVAYGRLNMRVETVENNRIGQIHVCVAPPVKDPNLSENRAADTP